MRGLYAGSARKNCGRVATLPAAGEALFPAASTIGTSRALTGRAPHGATLSEGMRSRAGPRRQPVGVRRLPPSPPSPPLLYRGGERASGKYRAAKDTGAGALARTSPMTAERRLRE